MRRSGYPLQTVVGAQLRSRHYRLDEEWAYVDEESGDARTLDIHALRPLQREFSESEGDRRLGVALVFLVECKQSDLPYVAFEAVSAPTTVDFPVVVGLPKRRIDVHVPGKSNFIRVHAAELLGLTNYGFARTPPLASSLSGVTRAGKKLELTGDAPYRSLVLPLTKATQHYRRFWRGPSVPASGGTWYARLTIPVAVVDIPLVLARTPDADPPIELVPWVRLFRRHAEEERDPWDLPDPSVVDVVHKDFFGEYEERYVRPYARAFQQRLRELQAPILAASIDIPGIDLPNTPRRRLYAAYKDAT